MKIIRTIQKKYSYKNCWEFASSLLNSKNKNILKSKNDIINLCCDEISDFWLNFNKKKISFYKYKKITKLINDYVFKNTPLPYLTKTINFYDYLFKIDNGIYIPQKETEILIDIIKENNLIKNKCKKKIKILDIGTGCGNIAISLSKLNQNFNLIGVDINNNAINIAKKNAIKNKIKNISFRYSNIFSKLGKEKFDLIISNPPYITLEEYNKLTNVVKKQPKEALLGGDDGMLFYREIISKASFFVYKHSIIILEINPNLKKKIISLFNFYFPLSKIKIINDYNNNSRILIAFLSKKNKA